MLLPRLTSCPDCSDASSLIDSIDCKLSEMSGSLYNNLVFMLNTPICREDMSDLLHYRRILTYKQCNYNYLSEFKIKQIASKIKLLTLGCLKLKCFKNTTTTSTTTSPPPFDCDIDSGTAVIIFQPGPFDCEIDSGSGVIIATVGPFEEV